MADVLVFYQYFCTPRGSWGTRHYELARRWVQRGHKVTIVTSIYDKSDLAPRGFVTRDRIEGIDVIAIDVRLSNTHGIVRRIASFAAFALLSSYFALREPADVVIASSGPLTAAVPGLLARWLRRKPLLFEVRDLLPEAAAQMGVLRSRAALAIARRIERLAYRSARTVVALSPGMKPWIESTMPGTDVRTIPNASDLDLFHPALDVPSEIRAATAGRFVLLYTGTLGAANAGDELVDMAHEARRRGLDDVLVVAIGEGKEKPRLMTRAKELGLDNIRFLDKRPKTEIAAWHAAAAAIIIGLKPFPILETSSPNKLFDALAAGRPVLNNTRGWIASLLDEHECGLTHAPGDIVTAVDDIERLLHDSALLAAMGQNARRLAEHDFARDELARRYAALFEIA